MDASIIDTKVQDVLNPSKSYALDELVKVKGNSIRYSDIAVIKPSIYAFWLINTNNQAESLHRKVKITGSNGSSEKIPFDWNLNNDFILLYVGKTTNFKNRLKKHLLLGTNTWEHKENDYLNKKTTACQLRAVVEHLIKNSSIDNGIDFMFSNVRVSVIELDGLIERFFAEDLAIGKGKPWFNVDSER